MKGLHRVLALVLTGMFVMSPVARAEPVPPAPCAAEEPEPPPAYPLPVQTTREIVAMFVPPRTNAELLSNLKIVLDEQLLAQPAFFDEAVLRVVFSTSDVQWVEPGTPGVASERLIRPTRIARIRFEASSRFAGMKVAVGVNHKCLARRPHPWRVGSFIPAHTYDSGYIHIQPDVPATLTAGEVQGVFGSVVGELQKECRSPLAIYYAGPEGPSRDAFRIHDAHFQPSHVGYPELCRAASDRGLPAGHPIAWVWMRLIQEDYTLPDPIMP